MDTSKLIESMLKNRKTIKDKIRENKLREHLTEEAIEQFQKPIMEQNSESLKELQKQTELVEEYHKKILPAIKEISQNQQKQLVKVYKKPAITTPLDTPF